MTSHNTSERLVTIYDTEGTKTIATNAATVEEVLEKTDVEVKELDAVEPGLKTELTGSDYYVTIHRARPVTVIDGTARKTVVVPDQSPQKMAEKAGVTTYPEDKLDISRTEDLVTEGVGLKLEVTRATPMTLLLYGQKLDIRTQSKTVGDLFKERNVTLGKEDGASAPAETPITPGMVLGIWRNGIQSINVEEPIKFPVKQIKDPTKDIGYKEVQNPGILGKRTVTYEINTQNGVEVARKEIQSTIVTPPVEQVEVVGTKAKPIDGDLAGALARLRGCEAGGNYANKRNPTYRGAYQFGYSTWANYGGYYDPADAPAEVQDQAAQALYKRRGWQPWPGCTAKLGLQDIYR